jgi:arylformamidase
MDTLIEQCRKAVTWIYDNAASIGADPDKLFIMGKPAGAHIGGMMVTTDWAAYGLPKDILKGAFLISGMYDLEPVRLTFRKEWLKLNCEAAVRNSPIRLIANGTCPIVVDCGAEETDEFRRQTGDFAQTGRSQGSLANISRFRTSITIQSTSF